MDTKKSRSKRKQPASEMPSEDLLDADPPTIDPYEVLNLDSDASADQIKSAYRKAALKHHPDKVPPEDQASAHTRFQSIAFAYALLSDPARRRRYDATGSTAEAAEADFDWAQFYREQFRDAVSADTIRAFAARYRDSDSERTDVLAAYTDHKGSLDAIFERVMLSSPADDDARFRAIIDAAIAAGDVTAYPAYRRESAATRTARAKRIKREASEAEALARELGVYDKLVGDDAKPPTQRGKRKSRAAAEEDSQAGLATLIRGNRQSREGFLDDLAARYGAKEKKRGRRPTVPDDEPDEDAFRAAAARLKKKKAAEVGCA